jgi:hypothetical protein
MHNTIDWRKRREKKPKDDRANLINMFRELKSRGEIPQAEVSSKFFKRVGYGSKRDDKLVDWWTLVKDFCWEQGYDINVVQVKGTRDFKYVMEERDE